MQELDNEFEIEESEISQKDKKKATTSIWVSAFVNFGTLGAVSSMILYGFLKNYLTISMLLLSATIFMVMSLGALWMAYRLKK